MSLPTRPRRIIANLDAEAELAHRGARPDAPPSRVELPAHVARRLSALGSLLRAFAEDGDRLWTPLPVASARLCDHESLPDVTLESGPLDATPPAARVLAWAETASVARHRSSAATPSAPAAIETSSSTGDAAPGTTSTLTRKGPPPSTAVTDLWDLARRSNVDATAHAHHRSFALETAIALGCALPGARMLRSLGELDAHLSGGGARAARTGWWVVKNPWSAAGRGQIRGRGLDFDTPADRRGAARWIDLHGEILFEPWMDRTADYGATAIVDADRTTKVRIHRALVDPFGRFIGIVVPSDEGPACGLDDAEAARLRETALRVGDRMRAVGYRGAFGVDAWRYRDHDGESRFHPLGEINARFTFGLVARTLVEKLTRGDATATATYALRIGSKPREDAAVTLLRPASDDATAVWLECYTGREDNLNAVGKDGGP